MKLSTLPVIAMLSLLVQAETSMATSGTLAPPPDEALYLRIAQIPNGDWSETDIGVLQRDGTALTTAYLRCAVSVLEDASACPWLPYDVSLEDAKYTHAAFQSVIFGVKSGNPLSAPDLFARHGPSAALADMLLGDHEVSTVYASMITAAYGEEVTRRYFTDGALGHYLHVLALEPGRGGNHFARAGGSAGSLPPSGRTRARAHYRGPSRARIMVRHVRDRRPPPSPH